jgi:ATP-binding cassette, subfamily G (WHITE), member 2, PDR
MFVIVGFFVFFTITYLAATEFVTAKETKGEVLLFPRHQRPKFPSQDDVEQFSTSQRLSNRFSNISRRVSTAIHKQTSIFHWRDICYDIKIKKEDRRILNHVDGWVKPGTLTVLMVSLDQT